MRSTLPLPSRQWLLPSAVIIASLLVSSGNSFLTKSHQPRRTTPPSLASSITRMRMSSFQQARLAEQLRLSNRETRKKGVVNGDANYREESPVAASETAGNATSSSLEAAEEARKILELENEAMPGHDETTLAPMMTYQKYLTMQEKRVKVAIRYSAEAGLRPFYLTVANQIKSAYPDVLLEKRILSPVGSDAGGDEAVFEVVVDGKTVIGKKNTKLLKVTSRSSRKGGGGGDGHHHKGRDDDKAKGRGDASSGGGKADSTPDIAGGRSIFVSMEKLDHELAKARKRRRPNTHYRSKEIVAASMMAGGRAGGVEGSIQEGGVAGNTVVGQSVGMTEAVIRLERLKAMSTRSRNRN